MTKIDINNPSWTDALVGLGACAGAVEWCRRQPDLATAWQVCERGDWMLWLVGRLAGPRGHVSRIPVVLAACDCAVLALPVWERRHPRDGRPHEAIRMARLWARGEATLEAVQRATETYYVAEAAYTADAANAAYGFDASDAACCAAAEAADAVAYAAYAAYATWAAAVEAGADAAVEAERRRILRECAEIVRRYYPEPPALGGSHE